MKEEVKLETLLLTIVFLGIIFAVLTPWTKTGAVASLGSLVGYFYFSGISSWTPIILFIVGLTLIVMEVFIPDFGLLGLLGIASMGLGLYFTTGSFGMAIRDLSIAVIVSGMLIFVLIRDGYSLSNLNKYVLFTSSSKPPEVEAREEKTEVTVGMDGEAVTPLRPSGKASFDEEAQTYDVLSGDGHISPGSPIVIHEIRGTKIVVRKK